MRAMLLLLLATGCADPLRQVYATSAEGELSLFQIALVEGYQLGAGTLRISMTDGAVWTCPVRLRGSETGVLGEVGVTELEITLQWRGARRADHLFARYWGVEAAGGVVNTHHELRARSVRGVNLRGSAREGAAVQAMANLTSVVLSQRGDCLIEHGFDDTGPPPEDDGADGDVYGVNFDGVDVDGVDVNGVNMDEPR